MIAVTTEGMSPGLVSSFIANLNQREMAQQLLTPLRLISRIYSCLT